MSQVRSRPRCDDNTCYASSGSYYRWRRHSIWTLVPSCGCSGFTHRLTETLIYFGAKRPLFVPNFLLDISIFVSV